MPKPAINTGKIGHGLLKKPRAFNSIAVAKRIIPLPKALAAPIVDGVAPGAKELSVPDVPQKHPAIMTKNVPLNEVIFVLKQILSEMIFHSHILSYSSLYTKQKFQSWRHRP
jgi:hypothetical protein